MAKGYKGKGKMAALQVFSDARGYLKAKYDPVIMAEILQDPEIKAVIKEQKITGDFAMALFKRMLVKKGTYDFYIKNKIKEGV
jgi:hypothetical protein